MPQVDDVPFELKHYTSPKTLVVGVTDGRTGADTLLILTGTVVFPPEMQRYGTSERLERKRLRFCVPQLPKLVTAKAQVRGMQVLTTMASFQIKSGGDRALAIDQAVIDWADDVGELRIGVDIAYQGPGTTINRVMYNAFVLAKTT
jgi:hypothetical protein